MPAQTGKSGLFAKVAAQAKSVHKELAEKPVQAGNAGLPEGIENGVAQLVDAHFGEYKEGPNKGKLFFMAAGIVKEPKVHNGVNVEGLRTQIGPEALCDTPQAQGKRKTFQDHYDWVLNELKKLDACPPTVDAVEATVATLVKVAPHFRFRTWKGTATPAFPNPRVNHEWLGICQYGGGAADPSAAVDETTTDVPDPEPAADGGGDAPTETATGGDEIDLMALAAELDAAGGGDPDAQAPLIKAATDAGFTEEDLSDVDRFPNWVAVAEVLTGAALETVEETAEEAEPEKPKVPEKGGKCRFKPLDAKTKKRGKAVECEITAVDNKTKTLALKNGKLAWKGVKFADVELV